MKLSKRPMITLAVVALLNLFVAIIAPNDETVIKIATDEDFFKLADIPVAVSLVAWICASISLVAAAIAVLMHFVAKRKQPGILTTLGFFAFAFTAVVYLYNGNDLTLTSLLQGSLALSVPLIFGSMAGVLS